MTALLHTERHVTGGNVAGTRTPALENFFFPSFQLTPIAVHATRV